MSPAKRKPLKEDKFFDKEDLVKDAKCIGLETDDEIETLRFVKFTKLGKDAGHITSIAAEQMINEYREADALNFARTIKKLLSEDNLEFRDLLLENAEARLREHKNRPK